VFAEVWEGGFEVGCLRDRGGWSWSASGIYGDSTELVEIY